MGAVNDVRTKILLDTGANVSAISESFAKKLRLKARASTDKQIDVQGINKGKLLTTSRTTVMVTLGWKIVYEFEVWIMDHHAGVDLIVGTDFMIPAGIRLDLYNSTARLPDEVIIPLFKARAAEITGPSYGDHVTDGPAESTSIQARMIAEFRLRRKQPSDETHELWMWRTKDWVPTLIHNSHRKPTRVLLTNVSGKLVWCPAHFPVVHWAPYGELAPDDGYVRLASARYRDWQVWYSRTHKISSRHRHNNRRASRRLSACARLSPAVRPFRDSSGGSRRDQATKPVKSSESQLSSLTSFHKTLCPPPKDGRRRASAFIGHREQRLLGWKSYGTPVDGRTGSLDSARLAIAHLANLALPGPT